MLGPLASREFNFWIDQYKQSRGVVWASKFSRGAKCPDSPLIRCISGHASRSPIFDPLFLSLTPTDARHDSSTGKHLMNVLARLTV